MYAPNHMTNVRTCHVNNIRTCHVINVRTCHVINVRTCHVINVRTCHVINVRRCHMINVRTKSRDLYVCVHHGVGVETANVMIKLDQIVKYVHMIANKPSQNVSKPPPFLLSINHPFNSITCYVAQR